MNRRRVRNAAIALAPTFATAGIHYLRSRFGPQMPKRSRSYTNGSTRPRKRGRIVPDSLIRKVIRSRKPARRRRMRRPRIGRSVRVGLNQMPRMFVKMQNCFHKSVSATATNYQGLALSLDMLNLQDPDSGTASLPFAQNFKEYALLYEKYKVHGVKVTAYFNGLTNNENDKFISTFYAEPPALDGSTPSDPYTLGSLNNVSSFLQQRGIRKKTILGSGANKSLSNTIHNGGYWSAKRIMTQGLDTYESAGVVNSDGTAAADPEAKPTIYHKIVCPVDGWATSDTYVVRYKVTFYVEWFSRRRFLEDTRTEP